MKKEEKLGMADYLVQGQKIKQAFFNQINMLIDWRPISNIINKHYQKGESATGRPSYDGLVLFKMGLLQTWYGLSDYEVEDRINDSISFSRFAGISLDAAVPDHSVLSRFRTELTSKGVYEKLFKAMNKKLDRHQILVKTGAIVDASIIDSQLKPKGKTEYVIAEDRSEEERSTNDQEQENQTQALIKKEQPGVDTQARWIKKAGKVRYGYKKHHVTDTEGLVLGVLTTPANINEITNLEAVFDAADLPKHTHIYADKGYRSAKNEELLALKKLKSRVLHKAKKGQALTEREKLRNKLIGKT